MVAKDGEKIIFERLGVGASFFGFVARQEADFSAERCVVRADKNPLVSAICDLSESRGGREKSLSGAEGAGDNDDRNGRGRKHESFEHHGLAGVSGVDGRKRMFDRGKVEREQAVFFEVETSDLTEGVVVKLGIVSGKFDILVGVEWGGIGENIGKFARSDFSV